MEEKVVRRGSVSTGKDRPLTIAVESLQEVKTVKSPARPVSIAADEAPEAASNAPPPPAQTQTEPALRRKSSSSSMPRKMIYELTALSSDSFLQRRHT